jgi:hypothetical protein
LLFGNYLWMALCTGNILMFPIQRKGRITVIKQSGLPVEVIMAFQTAFFARSIKLILMWIAVALSTACSKLREPLNRNILFTWFEMT